MRFVTGLGGAPPLVFRYETVGIDHGGAALTFADVSAKRQRLAKRKPALFRKTLFDRAPPEKQDVDAAVGTIGRSIFRHGERRFCCGRTPRLDPRHSAGLKLGDDLVGDFVIEARPVLAGTGANNML